MLGQGGFGMVFAVHDTKLDRECAMKFLLPEHTARPDILQRFLKEARSDRARIWIPQELAYQGRAGAPAGMLVFDLELVSIIATPPQ